MKILIAEDDRSVCEMLSIFFKKEQFQATFVYDGLSAEQRIKEKNWDLVILDWMMPGKDGLSLCKEIRRSMDVPIILLTANDGENERIDGLNSGADDYVSKPFSPTELIARIKAVMRRYDVHSKLQTVDDTSTEDLVQIADLIIHLTNREVSINGNSITNLTPKEFDLLTLFAKHPKKVFTREQLIEHIWGYDFYGEDRTVDVHIKRLRNKIAAPNRTFIATVWGVGYKFEE